MGRDDLAGVRRPHGVRPEGRLSQRPLGLLRPLSPQSATASIPALGFVAAPRRQRLRRRGCTFAPRPEEQLHPAVLLRALSDAHHRPRGRRESYEIFTAPVNWQLESGDRVELNVVPDWERLRRAVRDRGRRGVAAGARTTGGGIASEFESARQTAALGRGDAGGSAGSMAARSHAVQLEAPGRRRPLITFLARGRARRRPLPAGRLRPHARGHRVRLNLSPDLPGQQLPAVRHGEPSSSAPNTRLRWTFHPRGDVFLIYNHNLREIARSLATRRERAAVQGAVHGEAVAATSSCAPARDVGEAARQGRTERDR